MVSQPCRRSLQGPETTSASALILKQVERLEADLKQDGSSDYPYILIANLDKPEANWGFEVSLVKGIEYRNFTRDAFHIRKVTNVTQEGQWDATIPIEKYPTLAQRSVLIRGPSQDFWHRSADRYHQLGFCDKTKTVHEALETQIENDPSRLYSHWLIVLPQGTELENHILSDDAKHVKKMTNDLVATIKLNEGDEHEEEEVELLGLDVYWRIAIKGGEMLRSPERNLPKKKRFAHRKKP